MKKLTKILLTLLAVTGLLFAQNAKAQAPQKMSYQAVVRNTKSDIVASKQISLRISILQGAADGSVLYSENQSPNTNVNGLISIEIGNSVDFDKIDWSKGPFFIKTEVDPDGAENYTVVGTSQLLSVPYALHAKTAETITGNIQENDPNFTSSQAANITANDITKLSNLSGTNTGDQDLSGLATTSALSDSASSIRAAIPDVSGLATKTAITLANTLSNGNDANQMTIANVGSIKNVGSISFSSDSTSSEAAIDLSNAGKTFILPNYTTKQRDFLEKKTGTLIYNTDLKMFQGVALIKDTVLDANHVSGVGSGSSVYDYNGMPNPDPNMENHNMGNTAQVFQAESNDSLVKISVNMSISSGDGPYLLTFTLKSGNDPSSGYILSTQQVSITSSSFNWYDIHFKDPIHLTKGNSYTLIAEFANCQSTVNNAIEWQEGLNDSTSLPYWIGNGNGICPLRKYSYETFYGSYSCLFKVYVLSDALGWVNLNY